MRIRTLLLLCGLPVACARPRPEPVPGPAPVIIDGAFGEWSGAPVAAFAEGQDVLSARQRSDGRFIYLQLDFARPLNLLGLTSTLTVAVNADGDDASGATVNELRGTDFAVDFSPPNAAGRVTEGVLVRSFGRNGAVKATDTYPLDMVMQPSYETWRVELRLARGRLLGDSTSAPTFSATTYRARIGTLPAFTAMLAPRDTTTRLAAARDPLARAPSTQFRVLVWNVANEGILERPDRFRRVLEAVDPDLMILDEVAGKAGREGVARFLATVKPSRGQWHFTYGRAGGYQRTVIASRGPVEEFPELAFIAFTDSTVTPWLPLVPEERRGRERDSLPNGIATGGALVTIAGKRLAAFGVDLQSAGNRRESWQEVRRQTEARAIRDHAMAALRAHAPIDGVIQAGDHNLVGTRDPLDTLATIGRAFDGTPLSHALPLQLDSATAATWEGGKGQFPPGRLDWFNYTGRSLEVLRSFAFDVADLGETWRKAHGLDAEDSMKSSDHRPLVVDVRWR